MIDFQTSPDRYRHWRLAFDGPIATLTMDVDADAPLLGGYELKLNSYDLGVDIELADALQRVRAEHLDRRGAVFRLQTRHACARNDDFGDADWRIRCSIRRDRGRRDEHR